MSSIKYVGMDVHQAMTAIAVVDQKGRILQRTVIRTESEVLGGFFVGLGRGQVEVAFEEGCQSAWLYDLILPLVSRVVVANARKLGKGNKTDKVDALKLARKLRAGEIAEVYHGDHGTRDLKQVARCYQTLVADSVSTMARIRSIFRSVGVATGNEPLFAVGRREEWLLKLTGVGNAYRAARLFEQLDSEKVLRKQAKAEMVKVAKKHPDMALMKLLPGFGDVIAAEFIAIVDTPFRFRSKRNLWAYASLAVVQHESDEYYERDGRLQRKRKRTRTLGLNKNGNRRLKRILKTAAITSYWRDPMKPYFDQLIAKGMTKEIALVVLARKIGAIALAVWKSRTPFDPSLITPNQ